METLEEIHVSVTLNPEVVSLNPPRVKSGTVMRFMKIRRTWFSLVIISLCYKSSSDFQTSEVYSRGCVATVDLISWTEKRLILQHSRCVHRTSYHEIDFNTFRFRDIHFTPKNKVSVRHNFLWFLRLS